MSEHPSPYALDRVALGAPPPAGVAAHLSACARCASELEVRRGAEGPSPPWLAAVRASPAPRPRRRWAWLLPVPALAVVGIVLAVALRPAQVAQVAPGADATREKGGPAVTVYVKRGDAVSAWDGRSPVRPGDRLRVGVRVAGYAHLSVASLPSPGAPALLYSGPAAPGGETLLPLSFRVDAAGPAEVLSVIASGEPIALSAHAEPPERVRERGAFAVRLQLPKEVAP